MRFEIIRTLRNIKYLVFLIAVPVAFYLLWGRQSGTQDGVQVAALALVAMAVYAATGGALMAAGGGVADDRAQGWLRQLKVTPLGDAQWFAGRIVLGVLMVLPGVAGVSVAALTAGHVHLAAGRWAALIALLLAGSLPFGLLGLFLGLTLRGKTAQLGIVVVFFALTVLGGVIGAGPLPGVWERIRELTPSYGLVQGGNAVIAGHAPTLAQAGVLAAWTVLAGAAVLLRWRRSSGA
ncbi:ABC transporter permease [Microtetraspora niveoalba]|uniref:ABC transporter permease n=1 Tax=Microtetraspora niveoalba TaxID=46175 RepID=UPI0012FCE155|nr:ABC transporter permease [Microtetraspora niveoalba]